MEIFVPSKDELADKVQYTLLNDSIQPKLIASIHDYHLVVLTGVWFTNVSVIEVYPTFGP